VGFPKVDSLQIGSVKVGSAQIGTGENSSAEVSSLEVSSAEVSSTQVGSAQIGSREIGIAKVGFAQIGFVEVGVTEVGATKDGTAEVGFSKVGSAQIGSAEVGSAEIDFKNVSVLSPPQVPHLNSLSEDVKMFLFRHCTSLSFLSIFGQLTSVFDPNQKCVRYIIPPYCGLWRTHCFYPQLRAVSTTVEIKKLSLVDAVFTINTTLVF
jgi:hypothetical protein